MDICNRIHSPGFPSRTWTRSTPGWRSANDNILRKPALLKCRCSASRPRIKKSMFRKVLIANRGAIACRIIRSLKKMGVGSVAIYSDADANSLHVSQADEAVGIGGNTAAESYLDFQKVFAAARKTGAE